MKVAQNKSIFMGDYPFRQQGMDVRDKIAQKKQLYHKEAMRIVTTARDAEKRIDDGIEEIRSQVRQMQSANDEASRFLNDIKKSKNEAKEAFGVEDDSQEQKDLELLQKQYTINKHGSTKGVLTEEEQERLKNMGEMTEYQKQAMDLYEQEDYWKYDVMEKNSDAMTNAGRSIRKIQTDRLESHGMVDAEKAKEKMMEAASKEAMGMLKQDALEQMDEKTAEIEETAEKREEKEKELEERIEAAKEDKEQAEEIAQNTRENAKELTKQMTKSEEIASDVEDEIKKLAEQQKLLLEDLKGLTVDTNA